MRCILVPIPAFVLAIALSAHGRTPDAASLAVAGAATAVITDRDAVDDPFPIMRLRATEDQVTSILKQPETGPLVRLRRGDFEARVSAAGRAAADARLMPRIASARYTAAVVGGDLVGTAELDLIDGGGRLPQFLPLDTMRLAMTPASWGDGREAVVGVLSGGTGPSVCVDRSGPQTLKLGWSAAGTLEFGERRFELRVPPAVSTTLDLEAPSGQRPTVSGEVLLTGPFPIADPAHARWRLRIAGRSRLEFGIRPAGGNGVAATASLAAHIQMAPGQVAGTFEYDLHPAKGTVAEWEFAVDSGLYVTSVVVNNLANWTMDAAAPAADHRRLHVRLNQPGTGGKVLIAVVEPAPSPVRPPHAPLAMVRPIGAVLDEETVEVRLDPEVTLDRLSPGDYRLIESRSLSDRSQTLAFHGTLLAAGGNRSFRIPPTLDIRPAGALYATTEQLDWRVDGERFSARLRLGIRVKRDLLVSLTVRVPPEYTLVRAVAPENDLGITRTIFGDRIAIEFDRPLTTGQSADLVLEFRGPRVGAGRFAIPVFTPIGAIERTGVLGIDPGPLWEVAPHPAVGLIQTRWLDLSLPRPPSRAVAAFRYRGCDPAGTVILSPIRAIFVAEVNSHTEPTAEGAIERTEVAVHVQSGAVPSLLVMDSRPGPTERTWRVSAGDAAVAAVAAIPIADFARRFWLCAPAWSARIGSAAIRETKSEARIWVIRLSHPVSGDIVLETSTVRTGGTESDRPSSQILPLVVLGATTSRVLANSAYSGPGSALSGPEWAFAEAYLVTAVKTENNVEMVFGGTIRSSAGSYLPVRLPAGTEILSGGVGELWLDPGSLHVSAEGDLRLPLPSSRPVRFEVRYRLPIDSGFAAKIHSPIPRLPEPGAVVRRWWLFAGSSLPCWPLGGWDLGRPGDLPAFLGPPPMAGSNTLIVRNDAEAVRVGSSRVAFLAGAGLAVVLFLLIWAGSRVRSSSPVFPATAVLLVAGMAGWVGPPWLARAALAPLAVGLPGFAALAIIRGRRAASVLAAGILALVALTDGGSRAQPPAPAAVVILPRDAEGHESVVVPKQILDRLAAASRPKPPGTIVTSAGYEAKVEDATARVTAHFTVHALGDPEPIAVLPLTDARLESVNVDGAVAYPTASRPGIYTVPLPSSGRHEIEVRMAVPVMKTGTEWEFHFGVPETPAAHLVAALPSSAKQLQCLGRVGKQQITEGPSRRLEVDLGNIKTIQVRWREGAAGTAALKVREAYIWDVAEKGAELTAGYLTRVDQGTVSQLRYDLPAELEPVEVGLRPVEAGGSAALRDWLIVEQSGSRQLRLDLQGPTSDRMLVILTCRPSKPLTRQPVLRFPKPLLPGGMAGTDALYALQARDGLMRVSIESLAMTGLRPETTDVLVRDKEWVRALDHRLDAATIRVFRTGPGAGPELRPILSPAMERPAATLETIWQVEPSRAVAEGTIAWNGKTLLPQIDFTLPNAEVTEVRGPEVAGWRHSGGRITVWLSKPLAEGRIEWVGMVPTGQPSSKPPAPIYFDGVTPRLSDIRPATEKLTISAGEGWGLRVERDKGWEPVKAPTDSLVFQAANAPAMPVRVAMFPTAAKGLGTAIETGSPVPPSSRRPFEQATPRSSALPTQPVAETALPTVPVSPLQAGGTVVPAAVLWGSALAVLAVLMSRFPRATWSEQVGLAVGLFGSAVIGHWWFGLCAWLAARLVCTAENAWAPKLQTKTSAH